MDVKWWNWIAPLAILFIVILIGNAYYLGKQVANNESTGQIQKLTEVVKSRMLTTKYPIKMPRYPLGCGKEYKVAILNAPDPEKGARIIRFESFALGKGPFVILTDCTGSKHYVPWTSILRIEERK